jgi:cobalt-zinc-cadmium efflux system outer membrane protein
MTASGNAHPADDAELADRRHRLCRRSPAWLLTCLLAFSALADEPPGYAFNLQQLIATAQRDNKDLRAARYAVDIARARLLQAGTLPNPRINVDTANDVAFNNDGAYSASIGISQEFPIAGRILRQKDVARIDIELAQAEILDAERRLAGEVAANVYRVLVADRQIEARDALSAVDERLARATQSRFKAAEVSELDVNTIALDQQRLAQERALLRTQRTTTLQALNRQLGRPISAVLVVVEPLPAMDAAWSLDEALSKIKRRPDLRLAQLQIDRAQADIALSKAQRWEDWTVGLGVQQDRLSITGVPPQSADRALNLSVTIPLPLKSRSRGRTAATVAVAAQAEARAEALRLAIESEVAAAHAEVASFQVMLRNYETNLLPVSERNVALAEKGYTQGLLSIVEVVQVQRQHGELKAAALNALDQYLQALARLRTADAEYAPPTDTPP